jgi:hypothetical protein
MLVKLGRAASPYNQTLIPLYLSCEYSRKVGLSVESQEKASCRDTYVLLLAYAKNLRGQRANYVVRLVRLCIDMQSFQIENNVGKKEIVTNAQLTA